MKLADRTIETHSVGVATKSQFNIAQTSKMFKILSDSLYSDKVMAVIRELSTNAHDSHVSAGNKNPFKVILPTAANPNFVVRDYGTGLSQQDMENLYTTYGASNKNDSNDFVGCLGLGSKSPFAYTKSFTTSSYFNGKKYTYIAAIDDSGVPTLNLFHESDTNEANGLEIGFAVKQHDFQEFTNKAIRIFHYFRMKPIIEGGVSPNLKDHKYSNTNIILSGDGWRVCRINADNQYYPNAYHRIDSGIIAIMGNIAYPVTTSQIIGEDKPESPDHIQKWNRAFQKADIDSWKSFVGEIINSGLYLELDFGIGELEMDVSREGLQYTKQVIKTLRQKTQEIYMEMKEEFSKKISAAKNKVEAISLYYTMNELAGGWGVGASWKDSSGKEHPINSGNDLEYKIPAGKSLYVFNYKSSGFRSRRLVALTDKIHHETLTGKGYNYWNTTKKTGKISFFVCDIKSEETAKKIITKYCSQNDCFAYMMLDTKDFTQSHAGFDKFRQDIGEENIFKVSDYKHLSQNSGPRKSVTRNSSGSVSDQDVFFIYGSTKDSKTISNLYNDAQCLKVLSQDQLSEFLEEDEIVYVPMIRYKTVEDSGYPEIANIYSTLHDANIKYLIKDLIGNTKIYAIKSAFLKKLESDGHNLISFNDFLKRQLKAVSDKHFKAAASYRDMVEFCKTEYNSEEETKSGTYKYYNYGSTDKQFVFHMLNIFGLEYGQFISNKKLVESIDHVLIMEFFAQTVHETVFSIRRFKQQDYFAHITKLLEKMGMDGINSQTIRNSTVTYNHIISLINNKLYVGRNHELAKQYLEIIEANDTESYKITKMATLRKTIKEELDKNPMLKYTLGSHPVRGSIRDLQSGKNPISQLDERNDYYNSNDKDWLIQMDQDQIDLFRIQLSSLIK